MMVLPFALIICIALGGYAIVAVATRRRVKTEPKAIGDLFDHSHAAE